MPVWNTIGPNCIVDYIGLSKDVFLRSLGCSSFRGHFLAGHVETPQIQGAQTKICQGSNSEAGKALPKEGTLPSEMYPHILYIYIYSYIV